MEKLRIGVEGTQSRSNIHIGLSTPVLIKDQIVKEKFFLAGAGIYIGTFCTSANIDYRLLFLIFL